MGSVPEKFPEGLPEAGVSIEANTSTRAGTNRDLTLPAGTSQVHLRIEVPADTCLQVVVEAHTADGKTVGRQVLLFGASIPLDAYRRLPLPVIRLAGWARSIPNALPVWLVWLSLGLYAFTRLYALPSFPIYFFTDEAVQTVSAVDLLNNHFYSPTHELLPAYFENGSQYNLSASVYLQVLPYFLFGKSIWVTRATAALMTLIAAISVGLILKRVFKNPYPWLAVMFLSTTPVWFLHSRTAFETALATSFFAAFLYYYLLYRNENPRCLFGAVAMGALAFYSYSGMRMILLVLSILLFFSDLGYHWKNRKWVLLGLGTGVLLALPFLRFLINHPDASAWQMRILGSYLISDIPLVEKLTSFLREYLRGLDPLYWYLPGTFDLPRHVMLGYGNLLRQTLPLGLFGIGLAVRFIRTSAYRTLLFAILAAPTGAALVQLGATRILVMVIPMAILTALAASALMEWLYRHKNVPRALMGLVVFLLLASVNIYMLWDSLTNGPRWFTNYGLNGMQYGAQQVFSEIASYQKENPQTHIILSPTWANGTDVLARFFFPVPLPFDLGSVDGAIQHIQPLENHLYITTPEEFARIPRTRFADIRVERTVPYPDGSSGFYFVRLKYVDDIQAVVAQEEQQRRAPLTEIIPLNGQAVRISYPSLDIGQIQNLFMDDPDAFIRTKAINPMLLSFEFPTPQPMQGLTLRLGGAATEIHVNVWKPDQADSVKLDQTLPDSPILRNVQIKFPEELPVTRLTIEIKNTNDDADGNVHLWKLKFN